MQRQAVELEHQQCSDDGAIYLPPNITNMQLPTTQILLEINQFDGLILVVRVPSLCLQSLLLFCYIYR